jgi:cell fate (sporulation/competence/biofilm development) regulator YlbF (YheA/YmcA/DUF963 family)
LDRSDAQQLAQVILGLEAVKELKEVIERLITSDEA